jgi:hypothetical protein
VRGRGFGLAGVIAPALKLKSDRNDSLSEANFNRALSKSNSPLLGSRARLGEGVARTVILLRLLPEVFDSTERMERRASVESLDNRWYEFLWPFLPSTGARRSSSGSASSSIVSEMAVSLRVLYSSCNFQYVSSISWPSTPAIQKKSASGADESDVDARGMLRIGGGEDVMRAFAGGGQTGVLEAGSTPVLMD